MTVFDSIDGTVSEWAKTNGLTVYDLYKNAPVRSVVIIDTQGKKWQLWIEPEDAGGWCIRWWNYKGSVAEQGSTTEDLRRDLQSVTDRLRCDTA